MVIGDDKENKLNSARFDSDRELLEDKAWPSFNDNKLRRGNSGKGSTWTSSVPVPASDIPINNSNNRSMNRHGSMRNNSDESAQNDSGSLRNSSGRFDTDPSPLRRLQREENEDEDEDLDGEAEEQDPAEEEGGGDGEAAPAKTSLMALFGDYMMDDEDDDDDDDGGADGPEFNTCCVCMVKHKGVAFVLCGHSFCRLCSKEMWVQQDNCPLCNNYILEILDVF